MRGYPVFFRENMRTPCKKAMIAINNEVNFQHKLLKLDNTMLMYGIYNEEALEKLINTVQDIHNVTSSHERLFAGEHNPALCRLLYTNALGIQQYALNSLLFLRVVQYKYISLYKELITQLRSYVSAIRILDKGYLPTTLITPSKLQDILAEVRKSLQQTNPDYALVQMTSILQYATGNIWYQQGDEPCNSIPSIHTTIHSEATNPIPIGNCASSNTGHQHNSPILHPLACK